MLDAQFSGRKAVEMRLDSGEIVWVSQPSVFLIHAIRQQIEARFPEVDKTAYLTEIAEAMVAGEKVMTPEQEAAYTQAVAERQGKIRDELNDAWIAVAINLPRGRDKAITDYGPALKTARELAPQLSSNDWNAIVNNFIVSTVEDKRRVLTVATMNLPLEEAEVHNGLLLFRDSVSGDERKSSPDSGISVEADAPGAGGNGRVAALDPVR